MATGKDTAAEAAPPPHIFFFPSIFQVGEFGERLKEKKERKEQSKKRTIKAQSKWGEGV